MPHSGIQKEKNLLDAKHLFLYVQIGGWAFYFFIISFFHSTMSRKETPGFYLITFFEAFIGFCVTFLMRKKIIQKDILSHRLLKQLMHLLYLTFLYSLLYSILYMCMYLLSGYYLHDVNFPIFTRWLVQWIGFFILVLGWNLLYFSYHYVQKNNQEIVDKVRLQNTVKDLELNTIKAHVNPHFIFNALNSIRALVEEDPNKARVAITRLSNILRSSMQAERRKTTTLATELELVKDYLSLESIRYEDRLKVDFSIDDSILNQEIPPMTLQTLVENAIKHGISKEIAGGTIEIKAYRSDNTCYIVVSNTGKLQSNGTMDGFGVKSTIDRLHLLFGNDASFQLNQLNDTEVIATMRLPLSINA